jgi:hypothetical protein
MRSKQAVLKKIFELNNFINGHRALLSTNRSREEVMAHLERIEAKLKEIEVFINREEDNF